MQIGDINKNLYRQDTQARIRDIDLIKLIPKEN